jgi:hypothetical protein
MIDVAYDFALDTTDSKLSLLPESRAKYRDLQRADNIRADQRELPVSPRRHFY